MVKKCLTLGGLDAARKLIIEIANSVEAVPQIGQPQIGGDLASPADESAGGLVLRPMIHRASAAVEFQQANSSHYD